MRIDFITPQYVGATFMPLIPDWQCPADDRNGYMKSKTIIMKSIAMPNLYCYNYTILEYIFL